MYDQVMTKTAATRDDRTEATLRAAHQRERLAECQARLDKCQAKVTFYAEWVEIHGDSKSTHAKNARASLRRWTKRLDDYVSILGRIGYTVEGGVVARAAKEVSA